MNTINFSKISFNFLFISFIMLLFLLGGCAKKVPHTITLDNGQKAILTKGIVKKVNLKNNTILFKQLNGPKITLSISDFVSYKVISSVQDIKEGMSLEVIYQGKNNKHSVIQVKKLPDLGCGDT